MEYNAIKVSEEDHIVWVTFKRPDAKNALTPEVLSDLTELTKEVRDSADVKVVVLTGDGEAFCSGADLKYLQEAMSTDVEVALEFGQRVMDVTIAFSEIPVPTIAMVNGYTCVGGLELMLACDIAIAAEEALIGDRHMVRGMVGGPCLWQLPRRVGLQKAMEINLTGRWLSGKEAESYGLVLRAVPRARLKDEVEALLRQLRDKSQEQLKMAKKLLRAASAIQDEREAARYISVEQRKYKEGMSEMKHGVDAFVKKEGQPRH